MNDPLLENALRLRRAGKLAEAASLYAQILTREPEHFEALHGLGILRYQGGQLAEAERLIAQAVALRPQAADATYNRACLLAQMNRPDEALAAFDAALKAKPDYVEALVNRGSLLARLGRPGEALVSFDAVVALRPGIAEGWGNRAAALLALGRFGEAIASSDRALTLKPGYAEAGTIRARAMALLPSLPVFERETASGKFPEALESALRILTAIDDAFGRIDRIETGAPPAAPNDIVATKDFASRFSRAFLRLMQAPELVLSDRDYERFLVHHRWIDLMLDVAGMDPPLPADLRRRLALRPLNARDAFDLDAAWQENAAAAIPAFLHYLSSRTVFGEDAFALRERLLEWLPVRLSGTRLSALTLSRMADAFMHCSYAMTPKKHAIKGALMQQWRRACLDADAVEMTTPPAPTDRPNIVVIAENMRPGHSVHRTHSRSIAALKERFHVIGAVYPDPTGTEIEALFHECLPLSGKDVFDVAANLSRAIRAKNPALIFYVGAGMVPPIAALASLQLAPVQCVSYGHTATTMSGAMDHFVLPEDFVGAREMFSEHVVALPKAAMPFALRPGRTPTKPKSDGIVRVAVPASTMKLNAALFDAIGNIARAARTPARFHFFPLGASGLPYAALTESVRTRIPNATVFPEMPHEAYTEHLCACDFFLSPFPYGNMNSIVDAFRLGLPGVCLDGPEAHAHADGAFLRRIRLPPALVASSVEDYIAQAVRLIDDGGWREHCRTIVREADLNAAFFAGDARLFADAMRELL